MSTDRNFLSILQSVDAFFPIGAFTLSNGLEDYVVRERITSSEDLDDYLTGFLQVFAYNDLGILALAYQHAEDREYLLRLDATVAAVKSAAEVRIGSNRMCARYLKARNAMEDCPGELLWYHQCMQEKKAMGFHPIALGIYGASVGMDEQQLLVMYGYSILSAIVNNAVKLVPLSQMKGQKILFDHLEELDEIAAKAKTVDMREIGVSGGAYEIHCMNHEKLYSRQYMS